mgnify:CR=1 FL=1
MIIKKNQRKKEKISGKGIIYDYPVKSKKMGFSVQELDERTPGRIPERGEYKNKICNEICYVISGKGSVFINNKKINISEGDIYFVKPNQKSFLIAKKIKILTITKPDWYKEQCEVVGK